MNGPLAALRMDAGTSTRLRSLDGLRGVAALVVLFHHGSLVVPALADPYYSDSPSTPPDDAAWWATYTPLHLLWAGTEAVYIFFVLSGLVLTLPVLGRGRFSWRGYYPRRLLRLYLPVLAAVALGTSLALLAHRDPGPAASEWMQTRPGEVTAVGVLRDVTLVGGISRLISPLWSLQWEVLFSLLLPIYVLVAACWPRLWSVKLLGALAVVTLGSALGVSFAVYLPMFFVGALMAVHLTTLRQIADRISALQRPNQVWWALLIAAALLCSSHWLMRAAGIAEIPSPPAVLLGAAILVFLAAFWPTAAGVLERRSVQWLGKVSFSLYLVHEPIVIAAGVVVGEDRPWLALPLAVLVALPLAALFFRFIEAPSHRLARQISPRP